MKVKGTGGNVVLKNLYEEMLDTVEGGEASEAGNKFGRAEITDCASTAGIYKGKKVQRKCISGKDENKFHPI